MKHLTRALDSLKKEILTAGAVVEQAIDRSITSLVHRLPEVAAEVLAGDDRIDALEVEIEEECLKILALHQPVAADLRFIIAVMKVNNDLERMGDLAVNIAQRARYLGSHDPIDIPDEFFQMAAKVRLRVRWSLDSLVNQDVRMAKDVLISDSEIDDSHRNMFRIFEDLMAKDTSTIRRAVNALSASRYLERIADLATNVAEDVIFLVDGEVVRHRSGDDFCDDESSARLAKIMNSDFSI
ncbi:MAG: phosphate signaling complex protein PhoU [Planctomycetota bacterium]|nr:phosphate signaling complex protein PhoU [Planctomycetota bacterium]